MSEPQINPLLKISKVFISYSHKDADWKDRILKHLKPLESQRIIEIWHDAELRTGTEWNEQLLQHYQETDLALLLVSADFLVSDWINREEVPRLLERQRTNNVRLLPVLIRPCAWREVTWLSRLQFFPIPLRPLSELRTDQREKRLAELASIVAKFANDNASPELQPNAPPESSVSELEPNAPSKGGQGTPTDDEEDDESGDVSFEDLNLNQADFTEYAWDVLQAARRLGHSLPQGSGNFPEVCSTRGLVASLMLSGMEDKVGQYTGGWLLRQLNYDAESIRKRLNELFPVVGFITSFRDLFNEKGIARTVTPRFKRLLYMAQRLATQSIGKTAHVSARHLLAAAVRRAERPTNVGRFVRNFGVSEDEIRSKMIEQLPHWGVKDNPEVWRRLLDAVEERRLPTQIPIDTPEYTSGPSGFNSEYCAVGHRVEVQDQLRVEDFAKRLAELIALRETRLPLAIGLFGNWGSGKSHFINLMDQHMQKLAREAEAEWQTRMEEGVASRPDREIKAPWCRQIVPVYFNAWHYVDTNLWASLVAHIFDSLFGHLKPKVDALQKVQQLLEQASGAAARATEELAIAKEASVKAQADLNAAQTARKDQETFIKGILQGLDSLLPDLSQKEVRKRTAALLGLEEELKTFDQLQGVIAEANTTRGRARAWWNSFWNTPGRNWRMGWLAITIAAAYFIPKWLVSSDVIAEGRAFVARIVALVAPLAPLLAVVIAKANNALKTMEGWSERAKKAQLEAEETPAVKEAKQNAIAAHAREEAARTRLAEAEAKQKQLREEALSLTPQRRISRFIEQRANSSDYRGQLGLVSLARRDFEELSSLFTDEEALKQWLAAWKKIEKEAEAESEKAKAEAKEATNEKKAYEAAAARAKADKKTAEARAAKEEAEQLQKASDSIDRIVLFVDDLDRCQPDKVVDVLQAVHLLLAFPLFAVVVGVDQRCLRQSLQVQFKGLLTQAQKNQKDQKNQNEKDGKVPKPPLLEIDGERPATPLDYLEKIFHIPFHLPAMEKTGFESLVEKLTEPRSVVIAPAQPEKAEPQPRASTGAPGEIHIAPIRGENVPDQKPKVVSPAPEVQKKDEIAGDAKHTETPHVIGSVPLQRWERDALKEYYALIQTPRGATRLLNTYRLVRAGIPKDEWTTFCGNQKTSGEFRIALLLLAASAGCPAVAREWFSTLRKDGPRTLLPDEKPGKQWESFAALANQMVKNLSSSVTEERLNLWLDRVERFTF